MTIIRKDWVLVVGSAEAFAEKPFQGIEQEKI